MWKSAAAVIVAALVAGAITGLPVLATSVFATSSAGTRPIAAPSCPDRGWPYRHCGNHDIRIVTTDRLN
jgi:hypothetical protein